MNNLLAIVFSSISFGIFLTLMFVSLILFVINPSPIFILLIFSTIAMICSFIFMFVTFADISEELIKLKNG